MWKVRKVGPLGKGLIFDFLASSSIPETFCVCESVSLG